MWRQQNKSAEKDDTALEKSSVKEYSVANIQKYQEAYLDYLNAVKEEPEYTYSQLNEMKAWTEDQVPYIVEKIDKMIDAVHGYDMEKWGEKYFVCSWPEDFRPDTLPEVKDFQSLSKDGIDINFIFDILNQHEMLQSIYDDPYKSKENYYLWNLGLCSGDLSEILNNGKRIGSFF